MIKFYKRGQHPAGFIGFRVAVSVNRKLKQKYFSTKGIGSQKEFDDLYREADLLHDKYKSQQKKHQTRWKREAKPASVIRNPSGVTGVNICQGSHCSPEAPSSRPNILSWGFNSYGDRSYKAFYFTDKKSFIEARDKALRYRAKAMGLKRVVPQWQAQFCSYQVAADFLEYADG